MSKLLHKEITKATKFYKKAQAIQIKNHLIFLKSYYGQVYIKEIGRLA